ncbi:MAG: heparinase II/III family protein [Hyphomicrobiaceae bacterium]
MAHLTFGERLRVTAIGVGRRRRALLSKALGLPGIRLRYGPGRIEQLLIVPTDLRPTDPSFLHEVQHGHFGLAGTLARIDDMSPFDIPPPGRDWERALHGFAWLRHLSAASEPEAGDMARQLALEWIERYEVRQTHPIAWDPEILARRLISWLSQSPLLLEDCDEASYDAITRSLGAQLLRLSSTWRETPAGYPRLLAVIALLLADLSVAGRDSRTAADTQLLLSTLAAQILSDGGHVSRNPRVLVEALLDLLPLKECFRARGRPCPAGLETAIADMLAMLRHMRHDDGRIARFNGVGPPQQASLATVLTYAPLRQAPEDEPAAFTGPSGYVRIARHRTVIIADCGPAPQFELAGEAQAGCLSFELCSDGRLILANCGMPGAAYSDWIAAARSTASHNTLVLGETSSARLIAGNDLQRMLGLSPIRGPERVQATTRRGADGTISVVAQHDGYLGAFGIIHHRRIVLEGDGRRVYGTDELKPPKGTLRLKRDVPFSIHFHLFPGVECRRAEKFGAFEIEAGEQRWRIAAEGARAGLEESLHYASNGGPLVGLQVVLRGATFGESEVRWSLTRVA